MTMPENETTAGVPADSQRIQVDPDLLLALHRIDGHHYAPGAMKI